MGVALGYRTRYTAARILCQHTLLCREGRKDEAAYIRVLLNHHYFLITLIGSMAYKEHLCMFSLLCMLAARVAVSLEEGN